MVDTSQYYVLHCSQNWCVVDGSTEEPECNWPGELISEHATEEEAKAALATAQRSKVKPILCIDFDGVLNSYVSGWQGTTVVSDPPVKGAIEFLRLAVQHFRVAIYGSRSGQPGGIGAMQSWLWMWAMRDDSQRELPHWFKEIEWPTEKPPALVTLDDRALTFTGEWPEMGTLLEFKPWNKK